MALAAFCMTGICAVPPAILIDPDCPSNVPSSAFPSELDVVDCCCWQEVMKVLHKLRQRPNEMMCEDRNIMVHASCCLDLKPTTRIILIPSHIVHILSWKLPSLLFQSYVC